MRTAAIGIGSNSLRMLIADVSEGRLHRLRRYREGLRVFAALDERGNITEQMIAKACESVEGFRKEAVSQGVKKVHLFATSAVRDAANQDAFLEALRNATGLPLDIINGEEEAHLSFLGATEGERTGLIDIGGGSTEIVVGRGREIADAVSLQMGAVRLYRMHPIVSVMDAHAMTELAERIIEPEKARFLALQVEGWVGVGGTFTTGAAFVQQQPWQRRENIHGFRLTQETVLKALETLAPMPMEERVKLAYLQPQRADIVAHGFAILLACMRQLQISSISVSECGNLEGYLKQKYLLA
ncbi:MAG: Ppx/GppA family phosphatase [Clostridiales bacterium]|nr:Ppx/GppA family phosphatase [Clostridiales bacterium]